MKHKLSKIAKRILLFFWKLHKPLVRKNKELENTHSGETCFIFANGASLKYYDISKLPDNPAMVCAYSLVDKRMEALNVRYYVTTDSYCLYSFLYNTYPHVRKLQRNKVRPIFSGIFKNNEGIRIFVNVANFYSTLCRRKNINYFYHFGEKDTLNYDLADNFALCHGALDTMLGVAKYLGFSKAILMGCDYLGVPPVMGHFYADGKPYTTPAEDLAWYRERIKRVADGIGIDVTVILPEGVESPEFAYDSYENYFGLEKHYQENKEFIDAKHLSMLRDAAKSEQTLM